MKNRNQGCSPGVLMITLQILHIALCAPRWIHLPCDDTMIASHTLQVVTALWLLTSRRRRCMHFQGRTRHKCH